MKKRRGGRKIEKPIDADLDGEVENYEPSDSDDGFDEEERNLLNNAVGRKVQKGEEEVLKVYSSSDDSDEDEADEEGLVEGEGGEDGSDSEQDDALYGGGVGSDLDSDIEGKADDEDGLPDSKAWGASRKQYYDTDYVDQDYLGFDDEEAANQEEQEADAIQRRLLSHLEGTDFTLGLLDSVEGKKVEASKKKDEPVLEDDEKVEVDLSKLSKDEFIDLIKRKNPEMFPIIEKCKDRMKYLEEKVAPILELVENKSLKRSKAVNFVEAVHQIILHYAVNVLFYIHLKEQGLRTTNHPVLKRISGLDFLINELDVVRKKVDPQIDIILEKASNGEDLNIDPSIEKPIVPKPKNRKERRKIKFEFLRLKEEKSRIVEAKKRKLEEVQEVNFEQALSKKAKQEETPVVYSEEDSEDEEGEPEINEENVESGVDKRAVTFEMMKNKGLTPKRKKENRNPRVKHRNKFKKALVRRKGQVRAPRKEITKYGGEISGINPFVSKSIRIK